MVNDLALQRNKYKHLSDAEWHWFLQQIEGRERTADKLPTFASIPDWWYPVRLSCEQCSSELTARYKASLLSPLALGEGKGVRLSILRAVNPALPLFSQLYDVEITDQPLARTEKQTLKRYLYK